MSPRGLASYLDRSRYVDANNSHQSPTTSIIDATLSIPTIRQQTRGIVWLVSIESSCTLSNIEYGYIFVVEVGVVECRGCFCIDCC